VHLTELTVIRPDLAEGMARLRSITASSGMKLPGGRPHSSWPGSGRSFTARSGKSKFFIPNERWCLPSRSATVPWLVVGVVRANCRPRWPGCWGCTSPRLRLEAGEHEPSLTTLSRLSQVMGEDFSNVAITDPYRCPWRASNLKEEVLPGSAQFPADRVEFAG
jgi:hypothetical protein